MEPSQALYRRFEATLMVTVINLCCHTLLVYFNKHYNISPTQNHSRLGVTAGWQHGWPVATEVTALKLKQLKKKEEEEEKKSEVLFPL
jgi:hypothetical protein